VGDLRRGDTAFHLPPQRLRAFPCLRNDRHTGPGPALVGSPLHVIQDEIEALGFDLAEHSQ